MTKVHYIVIEHDPDPDFSWLEQDCYNPRHSSYEPTYRNEADMKAGRAAIDGDWYRNPENHVALEMVAYGEPGEGDAEWSEHKPRVVDALGNIDFLVDGDEWGTGTFYHLRQLDRYPYLRELAKEMGLPE